MTWSLVSTYPSGRMNSPDPLPLFAPALAVIVTIVGRTFLATVVETHTASWLVEPESLPQWAITPPTKAAAPNATNQFQRRRRCVCAVSAVTGPPIGLFVTLTKRASDDVT